MRALDSKLGWAIGVAVLFAAIGLFVLSGMPSVSAQADTTAPTVSSIAITSEPVTSEPGNTGTYFIDDIIELTVTFSEDVTVTGTPQLELDIGGSPKIAAYDSTDGSEAVFSYTVAEGDSDYDGITVGANKLTLNNGTIRDAADNDADLSHDALPVQSENIGDAGRPAYVLRPQNVDGIRPTITAVSIISDPGDDDKYGIGDEITIVVTFSEYIQPISATVESVTYSPNIELNIGGETKIADASSYTGSRLSFVYAVQAGDTDSDGISIDANKVNIDTPDDQVFLIHDLPSWTGSPAGNPADVTHEAVAADTGHRVDGVRPTVSSISITSDPGEDDTYGNGDNIEVTVTFDEDVIVTGEPQLELDVGSTAKTASFTSVSRTAVVFRYTVAGGDADTDGISIGANKLTLNDGHIRDATGNDASLEHEAIDADSGHKVSAPGGL